MRRLCTAQLVSQAAEDNPGAVALVAAGERLTYAELEARSSQLAAHLQSLGVGPEVVVAICLERSFEFVISALAVWKAGGAYLPLDPSWPVARRDAIVQDADAPVLITRHPLGGRARIVVDLACDAMVVAQGRRMVDFVETKREHLAYVSYTSGTSGSPKGVEITHGNLLNLVFWHRRAFNIVPGDRCSHLAALAFDAAVWEVWPHLSAGATVVLVDDQVRTSPELLQDWLVRERINVAFVPTTLAEPLIASSWPPSTDLRYLLTGSDVLHRYPVSGLPFKLVNNYGPTECTVVATSGVVAPGGESTLPTIGAGIAHTPIYLLNGNLEPVAPGETGEIFIGGSNVGRGYRKQPALTETRFVPDPFSGRPGARMYRSGDLGSTLPTGQIQFHGRVDEQQKIRGYRVEPAEVASVLTRHPDVHTCVVTGYDDVSGRKLAAYVVPEAETRPEAAELREFLRQRLPEYMIPSAFLRLEALPLNSRGKLDRDRLPAPNQAQGRDESGYRAPQSPVEEQVAGIVAALMGLKQVGLDDNFFLLGGHSLLGTQLVLRVRQKFSVDITLRHLFEAQTVGKLAARVENMLMAKLESMSEEEAVRLLALAPEFETAEWER
jgi:amino acid adenylation domain-containing protein